MLQSMGSQRVRQDCDSQTVTEQQQEQRVWIGIGDGGEYRLVKRAAD